MEQLIQSYYNAILRVDPTQEQIDLWLDRIDENDPEPGIEDLTEALCDQADEVLSIMRIYQVVLGRVPDPGGLDFWVQVFRDMQDTNPDLTYREALVETIRDWLSSEEFVAVYGGDLTDEEYVALLYENVLNRSPDEEGSNFWVSELENGVITREELVVAFSESEEFKQSVDAEAKGILLYDAQTSSEDTIDDPEHRVENDDPYQGELQNEAPTDILVNADTGVDEDAANGDAVSEGQLTAVDRDAGETFTWELIDPSGAFGLDDPSAQQPNIIVVDASTLDHETADVMTVTVRVTDSRGNTYEEDVDININDVNEAPYNLQPSGTVEIDDVDAVDEQGDVVVTLTVDDDDADDSHTFALISQTMPGTFEIVGNELQVADPTLLGTGIYEVTISATDSGGLSTEQTITVDLSGLDRTGENFAFTLDQDALSGTDRDDVFRANAGNSDGDGRTANAGDFADGGDGYDRFVLFRPNDDDDPDRAYVTGVELTDIEVLEFVNADDSTSEDPAEATELDWGDCDPLIDMPFLAPEDTSSIVFDANLSPDIDRVVVRDSAGSAYVRDLQRDFWTQTEGDETDTGPTVDIIDVTAEAIWIDSDAQSKQFEDVDGDGKDDGEIVFNLDEARINELYITENASDAEPREDDESQGDRGEQVGTITLRATGVPSIIGNIVNGEDYNDESGRSTHTLNIEVSDLTGSRPTSDRGEDAGENNAAAIDLFVGQFGEDDTDGLGDGLEGLENVNISGGGDVFLSFDDDGDHLVDDDGDGFGLEIVDGAGNSFFSFLEGGFANDDDDYASVSIDGGDGYDTLIIYASDLEDDPDCLENVTNIERIVLLDSEGGPIDGFDDCLLGGEGDEFLIGGKYDDFIDAGPGGTDALVGDYGKPDPDDDDTEAGQDVFVASARENNADAFGVSGYDNDLMPHDDYGTLLEKAGLEDDTDGPDGGVEGVVYVLDFNQGGGGDYSYTPHSNGAFDKEENTTEGGRFYSRLEEAFGPDVDRIQGDKLAFRDSNGELDEYGLVTNYREEEDNAKERDDADAAAFNAFSANENLRYYVNARTFEDALFEREGLVWGADVTEEQVIAAFEDLEDGSDDGDVEGWSSQELVDIVMAAKGDSWLRVYYNEEGTDAAPEAVMELVGLDSTSQFSFEDIVGKDAIDDCTDPFEYVFC